MTPSEEKEEVREYVWFLTVVALLTLGIILAAVILDVFDPADFLVALMLSFIICLLVPAMRRL